MIGFSLGSAGVLRAATAPPLVAPTSRDVEFSVLGAEDPAAPLEVSIREVASSLDVRPVPARGSSSPLARVVIDLRAADHITISIDDAAGASVARRTLPRGSSAEVLREEIAIVLHDSIALAIARHPTSPPPVPVTPPSTSPPQPNSPAESTSSVDRSHSPHVDLATSFALRGHDPSSGPVLGFGVAGRVVSNSGTVRPGASLFAEIDAPFNVDGSPIDLHVAPYLFRALPFAEVILDHSFALEGAFGGGLDITHVVARSSGVGVTLRDPTTRVSPILTASIGGRAKLGGTQAVLSLGSDLDLDPHRYVIAGSSGNQAAIAPWRLRPFAMVTIWFPIVGEPDAAP